LPRQPEEWATRPAEIAKRIAFGGTPRSTGHLIR